MYEDEVIDHLYSKRGRGVGKPKKVWPNWPDSSDAMARLKMAEPAELSHFEPS